MREGSVSDGSERGVDLEWLVESWRRRLAGFLFGIVVCFCLLVLFLCLNPIPNGCVDGIPFTVHVVPRNVLFSKPEYIHLINDFEAKNHPRFHAQRAKTYTTAAG